MTDHSTYLIAEPIERCVEVVLRQSTFASERVESELARAAPGAVVHQSGVQLGMHYAPNRWLLIEPDDAYLSSTAPPAQTHVFEVSGKWCQFRVEGDDGRRALRCGFDPDITLGNRSCARLSLFDCPTVVVRLDNEFKVYVEASFAQSFQTAIQKLNRGRQS